MLKKEQIEKYLNKCLTTGADFAEIFLEESINRKINLFDKQIQNVNTEMIKGIGIRISLKEKVVYGSTNDLNNIDSLIERLITNFKDKPLNIKIKLPRKTIYKDNIIIPHNKFEIQDKKELLYKIDKIARNESKKIHQVDSKLIEEDKKIIIANTNNIYKEDNRTLTRLTINIFAKENEKIEDFFYGPGFKMGYEFLDNLNIEEITKNTAQVALTKLDAIECPSGQMPVIIGNGFGGVIFHEACVHALEATTVAKGSSVFNNMLNKKIASDKVTIIDDGTLKNKWGSINIDDEGMKSQKNILIENGILTKYLVDYINGKKMNSKPTGSGRRQNYKYAPTSRMSNTYLASGSDKIDDMIKSIKYGIYAKSMGGGCVEPTTGDFNFAVQEAYLIENGKITKPIKGASLIGNGKEIIKEVSMVSNDLELAAGVCGSLSGWVFTTVGQPTIKVDKIIVGGKGEKVNV